MAAMGACVVGGMHGRGCARGHVWRGGGCGVAGKTAIAAVVLILLECILIFLVFLWCFFFQTQSWALDNCLRHTTVLLDPASLAN